MSKTPHMSCFNCSLKGLHPLSQLSKQDSKRIDRDKTIHSYNRGDVVFHEGTANLAAYCVHSGWLELYRENKPGRAHGIRLIGPGSLVGHLGVLTDRPYESSAKVVDSATLCIIPKPTILTLLSNSHAFTRALLGSVVEDLIFTLRQMSSFTHNTATERLARLLLEVGNLALGERPTKGTCEILLLRSQLAELGGITAETCSRILAQLKDAGIIELTRKSIVVKNPKLLRKTAGDDIPSTA